MKCFDMNRNAPESIVEENVYFLIDKPNVPFVHKLKRRLCPFTSFIIQGIVDDNALRFEVNLVAGHGDKPDIVYHFNPRLDQLYTARNSRFGGSWGSEEGNSQLKFPFRCGQPFCIEICLTDVKFLVAVDGAHYCTYRYRIAVDTITGIRVDGGVRLSQVLQFSTSAYPSLLPQFLPVPERKPVHDRNSAQEASVVYNLKSPLRPQSSVIVQGVVNDNATRFEVNLLVGGHGEKPDIGFHFNPRLDQQYTARNTRLGGCWGPEEGDSHENFPFHRGDPFYLEIYAAGSKFLIAVNGLHLYTYRHRSPLNDIIKVQVQGGVTLSNVHVQSTLKYPSPLPQFLGTSDDKLILQAGDFSKNSHLKVPFTHELKSRLHPQSAIIIQGIVGHNATRFEIDLIVGHDVRPDIAFHVNPRLDQLYTARNSRFNGIWGHEEGSSERKFPFRCGQPFFLEIFLTESKFMVAVDGAHYCSYKYRMSLVGITSIHVEGGVKLSQVLLHSSSHYPSPMPDYLPCPDIKPVILQTDATNPDAKLVPFIHKLDSKLYPQSSLVIQGSLPDNLIRFAINLMIDFGEKQDIAFHFNPRLNQMYTARNSRLGGSWGTEEGNSKEKFPFRNSGSFYLEIFFTQSKFMVALDGNHYCSFKYRTPLSKITSIQVEGGVKIMQVLMHSASSYPSPVLEFIPSPENKPDLQAVRINSTSSVNQIVPFVHELGSSDLHPQSTVIVQGVVHNKAIRFDVNLLMGRGDKSDIAFHFNPRFDQFYSARNSRLEGKWGPEEGNSHQKFPFVRGKPFYLEIFLTHSEFLVAVNGIHYCSYGFRTALHHVTSIQVTGVREPRVDVRPATIYPSSPPADLATSPYKFQLADHGITSNPTQITPVYGILKGKLRRNSKIEIRGRIKLLPYSFYVNLQEGTEYWPHPLVPLHLSVRFCQGGGQVTLANSWIRKKWGQEELLQNKFFFTPGYSFTLCISCLDDNYHVKVDDQFLLAYKHRVPYTIVDTLLIQGDVFIHDISVHL